MRIGTAIVFLRRDGAPLPTGCAGHVGWGFAAGDGDFAFGSTENPDGGPIVARGGDNGFWQMRGDFAAMLGEMRRRDYEIYSSATFREAAPDAALAKAREVGASGYGVIGNNCLDHTYRVLKAYGQPDLPWPLNHPSPNDWFALHNGEKHNLLEDQ